MKLSKIKLLFILLNLCFVQCGRAYSEGNSFDLYNSENAEVSNDKGIDAPSSDKNLYTAKVIRIVDGDTIEVLFHELPVMIRLAHIDTPEKKQAFGKRAKQALSDLCFGQEIQFEFDKKDRNGRYICVIYDANGKNLNQEMIKLGMAWHFKKYSEDNTYAELEKEARESKIGLWQDPNPIAPWNWRKK